jgi:hypothetical protein
MREKYINNHEQEKIFEKLDLTLKDKWAEPYTDKGRMILFETMNMASAKAYDMAIAEIGREMQLTPFHQLDYRNKEDGCYSGWEFWGATDIKQLEDLLPKIHKKAEENFHYWKDNGVLEK